MSNLKKRSHPFKKETSSVKHRFIAKEKTIYPEQCEFGQLIFSEKIALNIDYRNERKVMRFFDRNFPAQNRYLSFEEQNQYQVLLEEKPLRFLSGEILNGKYNFCLTCEEKPRLLCSQTHHHSYLSNGKKVLGIGTLTFDQGQLLEISNSSGHYKPTNNQMINVIKALHYESEDDLKVYVSYSQLPLQIFAVSEIVTSDDFSSLTPIKENQTINLETGKIEKIKLRGYSSFNAKNSNNLPVTFQTNSNLKLKEDLEKKYEEIVTTYQL